MKRIQHVLHASDFSRASKPAFDRALQLARLARARLTVIHVLNPVMPFVGDGYVPPQLYDQLATDAARRAQRQLGRLLDRARAAKVRVTGAILEGLAHEQIVRAAKSKRADVIVMGTHGHTGLKRVVLGSVAGRVVATASCPVLTVRG